MDDQISEVLKRLEQVEHKLTEVSTRLDAIESRPSGNTNHLEKKNPKGKKFLYIGIPILLLCLLIGGFFAFRAIQKPSYAKAEIGDIITFGQYEQNNSEADGLEPIEWIVLDKQDGALLLLSKYTLYTDRYKSEFGYLYPWENSSIRESLNSDFISVAFSPQEQSRICQKESILQGMVFLLSREEVKSYFPTEESRKVSPTDTCLNKTKVSNKGLKNAYAWWTRSQNDNDQYYHVEESGVIKASTSRLFGIRPALWLDTTK